MFIDSVPKYLNIRFQQHLEKKNPLTQARQPFSKRDWGRGRQWDRGREKEIKTAIQGEKSAGVHQLCPEKGSRKEKEDLLETDASFADREANKQTDKQIEGQSEEDTVHTLPNVSSSGLYLYLIYSGCLHSTVWDTDTHTPTSTHRVVLSHRQSEYCLTYSLESICTVSLLGKSSPWLPSLIASFSNKGLIKQSMKTDLASLYHIPTGADLLASDEKTCRFASRREQKLK